MALTTLKSCRLFAGGYDVTGVSNTVELTVDAEELDATTFLPEGHPDSGWKKVQGGLFSSTLSAGGFWESDADDPKVNDVMWADLAKNSVYAFGVDGAAVGATAFVTKMLPKQYKVGDQVGAIAPWSLSTSGTWPCPMGYFLHSPGTVRTASGTGTAIEVGAVPAGKSMYAVLHVLSAAGAAPTLDVKVQSDDAEAFTDPTDRITFTQVTTARSAQANRLAGGTAGIADDWWRVSWDITGVDSSLLFVVAVGIQ